MQLISYPKENVEIPLNFYDDLKKQTAEEIKWAKIVASNIQPDSTEANPSVSWTSHHSKENRDKSDKCHTINSSLPLIDHLSHDINFQSHIMKIAMDYTNFLNPGQRTIGCSDCPLYAIKKKLQWSNPNVFPSGQYLPFMGGLHIEQLFLKINGQLTKGTGMDAIIGKAGLEYIGLETAFTDVNDIKKARYSIQVEVACLYKMLEAAHLASGVALDLMTWAEQQTGSMFRYWFQVMLFQLNILSFVRSLRESDMKLFLSSLKAAVPMCFALDRMHYARWLSVFIRDLEILSVEDKALFDRLGEHLSVRSTDSEFSKVAYDQRHEQNNKMII